MARTAARRVPGPHSTWFLTAAAKISRASSSGVCLAGTAPSTGARAVIRTGMSWVCGRLSGIFRLGSTRHPSKKYMPGNGMIS